MYWAVVSGAPVGLSGPVTWVNRGLARSWLAAAVSGAGLSQTGAPKVKIRLVGLAAACGKCRVSSAVPAAESLLAGGAVVPPNPVPA